MPPKRVKPASRNETPNRAQIEAPEARANAKVTSAVASKKRKAQDEDEYILKYAQQIQQKELAKKLMLQQQSKASSTGSKTVGTTPVKKSNSKLLSQTPQQRPSNLKKTSVTASGRKSRSALKEPPKMDDDEEDDDEEDDEEEDEEEDEPIVLPPSSKRRRTDRSNDGPIATSSAKITTAMVSIATDHAASGRTDPHHDRAKQWYQEKMVTSVQQRPSNTFGTTTSVQQPAVDGPSTPKPPPLAYYSDAFSTTSHGVSFAPSTMLSRTEVLTPPRRNTTTSANTTPYYRPQQQDMTRIVEKPPSTQSLRHRSNTSSFPKRSSSVEKAPFGSPLPTIPSTMQSTKASVTSAQSPLLTLPSTDELNNAQHHHEPTILSPNYNRRNNYSDEDEADTMLYQRQHYLQAADKEEEKQQDSVAEVDHFQGNKPKVSIGNKDAWIASIAFVCVLLLSFLVALVMDPVAVLPDSTISYFSTRIMMSEPSTVAKNQPCFMDHPIRNNVEIEEEIALIGHSSRVCGDQAQPCPHGGHCMDGKLKMCYDSYLQVSPDGTSCLFTDDAQRDFDAILDLLNKYTVQHICMGLKRAKNPFLVRESSSSSSLHEQHNDSSAVFTTLEPIRRTPLFDYRSITDVLLLQYNPKLLLHATNENINADDTNNGLVLVSKIIVERNERDGSILIGLHPMQNVPLPFDCYLTKIAFSILKTLMVWMGTLSVWIVSRIIMCYIEYPIALIGLTITLSLVALVIQKRNRARQAQIQFTNEVVSFRERVYDELMKDQNTSVPARIICDRIAWNLYPKSNQKRRRVHEVIFPYVSRDLETDSRIIVSWRATTTGILGRTTTAPELHWQWNDTQPHTSTASILPTKS